MADIRVTPLLDDFQRPDEDPVQPPWYQVAAYAEMKLVSENLRGKSLIGASGAYFSSFTVSRNIEMWGITGGSPGLTNGWRWGVFTPDIVGGLDVGYEAIAYSATTGDPWLLRRHDSDGWTDIDGNADTGLPGSDDVLLMRRTPSAVEAWRSLDSGLNWTLMLSAEDTTYMGPFYFWLGTEGEETSWEGLGGGLINRPQIYRWLRGIDT